MSFLDLRSRNFTVTIYDASGANPLDVSDAIASFDFGDSQEDRSGWCYLTGSITFNVYSRGFPESFDCRLNATRWARGNKIELQIADTSGVLTTPLHGGTLRILKDPSPPLSDQQELTLEVGCLASLLNYRNPPDDQSGVELGVSTQRGTVVNNLLLAAGFENGFIDTLPYPLDAPVFRLSGGYIQQAGELAYAAGYVLWVDSNEAVRASAIDLTPGATYFSITAGASEQEFEPLQDVETPVEKVRVTSTGSKAESVQDPEPQYTIHRAKANSIFTTSDDSQIVIGDSLTRFIAATTANPITTHRERKLLGLLIPDFYPNNRSLVVAQFTREESLYTAGTNKLKRKNTLTRQLKGVALPDYYPGSTETMDSRFVELIYDYDGEVTRQITTNTYEPYAIVNPELYASIEELPAPSDLVLSTSVVQTWKRYGSGYSTTTSTTNYKRSLATSGGSTGSVSSTSAQPPAPERRQESTIQKDVQIVGEANFTPRAGAAFAEREREFQLGAGTVTDKSQLDAVAQRIGAIMIGRSLGCTFVTNVRDEWLTNYTPFARIDVVDGDNTFAYVADGWTLSLTDNEATLGADGIWVGTVINDAPQPTPPYSLKRVVQVELTLDGATAQQDYPTSAGTRTTTIALDFVQTPNRDRRATIRHDLELYASGSSEGGGAIGGGAEYSGSGSDRTITVSVGGETTDWVMIFERLVGRASVFDSDRTAGYWMGFTGGSEILESDSLTAFGVDGFDLGTNFGLNADVNKVGSDYMAWTLVENASFEVLTWTGDGVNGRTISHSLGTTPTVIMIGRRNLAQSWTIYHTSLGNTLAFEFPGINAIAGEWNNTDPTPTEFTLSGSERVNGLDFSEIGYEYVAYLWSVPAGSYTGDGNDPGPSVDAGEEPSRVWIISVYNDSETVRTEMTIFDNVRNPTNPRDKAARIYDNNFGGETTGQGAIDFTATGFVPNGDGQVNRSGQVYYYWYF